MVTGTVKTIKCVVWDLDNTLWQGTILEDRHVRLDDSVRELIRVLDSRGILQSVASKNHYDLAWSRLEELGIAEYFILPQIGWGPKSASVSRIMETLNFAESVIAFVDDQPAERAEVAFHLPEVRCYSPEQLSGLADLAEFVPANITEDARRRRLMYQASFIRDAAREEFSGPDEEFLRSLELVLKITPADPESLTRVEELTLRTSQMNATGVHYSDADLRALLLDPAHEVLVATLTDRYGPHGAIGVVLLEKYADCWHLRLLATSCRVVSFGIGTVILNWLISRAQRAGVHLVADFRRTERNRMMEMAYRFAGFTESNCLCIGTLPESDAEIQRFHLVPDERSVPDTIRFEAPGSLPVAPQIEQTGV
ncbi:HAD-IIIC family phosphatase [Nocardia sp. NPDC046473]|uniref:HAD-IIIC family phosphatase n=1 Tax=Nocardia sp. NPDC046473 TaxID=3155733 RepID=UPI0033CB4BC6